MTCISSLHLQVLWVPPGNDSHKLLMLVEKKEHDTNKLCVFSSVEMAFQSLG